MSQKSATPHNYALRTSRGPVVVRRPHTMYWRGPRFPDWHAQGEAWSRRPGEKIGTRRWSDQRSRDMVMSACFDRWIAEADMPLFAILPPGTSVNATVDFGPIMRGQPGIITGRIPGTWLPWRRAVYVCAFLGGISVTATRSQIMRHQHGFSREMLEDPLWFLHGRHMPFGPRNAPAATKSDAADAE